MTVEASRPRCTARRRSRLLLCAAVFGAVAALGVPADAAAPSPYGVPVLPDITAFPNYRPIGQIVDFNDEGDAVIEEFDDFDAAALVLADGTNVSLAGVFGNVTALNNDADVVGYANAEGVLYHAGTATVLPMLPAGAYAQPVDINDSGTIVGQQYFGAHGGGAASAAAVRWSGPDHVVTAIDPGDPTAVVTVVDDAGWAAGSVQGHAASFSPDDVVRPLHRLPGESASAVQAINGSGVMVGVSTVGQRDLPVEWQPNGDVTRLATRKGASLDPWSINDAGEIVGDVSRRGDTVLRPVYWSDPAHLGNLPNPAFPAGYGQYVAKVINNHDVIAGSGFPFLPAQDAEFPLLWTRTGS